MKARYILKKIAKLNLKDVILLNPPPKKKCYYDMFENEGLSLRVCLVKLIDNLTDNYKLVEPFWKN